MNSKAHKKHTDIARPLLGTFHRNEWAIHGAACSVIQALSSRIIQGLSKGWKCGYLDANHAAEGVPVPLPSPLKEGAFLSDTAHEQYHEMQLQKKLNDFSYRQLFNEADLMLLNGNHFQGLAQIVIIEESKKESLRRRLPGLTDIQLVLLSDNADGVFDFIQAVTAGREIPVYRLEETEKIVTFLEDKMQIGTPTVNGLVLAGGKSTRMGFDKGNILWHGKEQRYYLADLLQMLCAEVYISCRAEQKGMTDPSYKELPDTFTGLGPFGAILSAFREHPDKAWLIVASDLPLMDVETLQFLKDHRCPTSMATSFESPFNHFPEPLVTLWEPKSYPVLLSFLSQGYSCPGKALRNIETTMLAVSDPSKFTNVNTPEDFEKVQNILGTQSAVHDGK